MNAQTAKQLSIDNSQEEIEEIKSLILKACKLGELFIHIKNFKRDATSMYFKQKGYDITPGPIVTISWK